MSGAAGRWLPRGLLRRLHGDERGTISLVTVLATMLLAMLLGQVINVTRQVDRKIRLQNAADAATVGGVSILARGMNHLAYTNQLLGETFAMTAIMREGRDHHSRTIIPDVLTAWNNAAGVLRNSPFQKFRDLGMAIPGRLPAEQATVDAYAAWVSAASATMLGTLEGILGAPGNDGSIPMFQRVLVQTTPAIAQRMTLELARRNSASNAVDGTADDGSKTFQAVLFRVDGQVVGEPTAPDRRFLPVVDPVIDQFPNQAGFRQLAVLQRESIAQRYLNNWNNTLMAGFDRYAKMSRYSSFWRGFTCGQLRYLLTVEYPGTNLPTLIRQPVTGNTINVPVPEEDFVFVGVASVPPLEGILPRLFRSPIESDTQAFSQSLMFIPARRLVYANFGPSDTTINLGGIPGTPVQEVIPGGGGPSGQTVVRERVPTDWTVLNQRWQAKLVPATAVRLADFLQSTAMTPDLFRPIRPPSLTGINDGDLQTVNTH